MQKLFLYLAVCSVHAQDLDLISKPEYRKSVINAIDRLEDTNYPYMLARLQAIRKQHDHKFSQLSERIKILTKQQTQDSFTAKNSSLLTSLAIGLATTTATFARKFAKKKDDDHLKPIATAALLLGAGAGSLAVITLKIRDALCARAKHNRQIELQKCRDRLLEMNNETPEQRAILDQIIMKEKELDQRTQAVYKEWVQDSQAIEKAIADLQPQTTTISCVDNAPTANDCIDRASFPSVAQSIAHHDRKDIKTLLEEPITLLSDTPIANVKHTTEASCQVSEECFLSMDDINIRFGKAVQEGNILEIKKFIDLGANIEQQYDWRCDRYIDPNHSTALCYAAAKGYDAAVDILLQHHANTETCHGHHTPLLLAVQRNHTACVEKLIQAGANINAVNACHKNALYFAAHHKNVGLMDKLLMAGIEAQATLRDFQSQSYLGYNGHAREAIKILIEERVALFSALFLSKQINKVKSQEAAQAI